MGLRNGQEHRARQSGRAKSRSERAVTRLRHRYHTARCAELIGAARGAQWMERERREAVRGPAPLPGSWGRAAPMRILGNGEAKRGKGKRAAVLASRAEQERRSPCRKEQRRGGAGKLPQEQPGRGRLDTPPLWAAVPGGRGAELPSCPCSEPGAASSRAWSPAAPSRGLQLPSLPWGWGLVTKVPVGLWSGEHGGRFSSESSPRARPAAGPAQGNVQRCCVTTWSSNLEGVGKAFLLMKSWKQWHIS